MALRLSGFGRFPSRISKVKCLRLLSSQQLPPNEPFTNFEDPIVRERLNEALARVNGQVEDIPIVIGGQEFRTNDVKYQVSPYDHQKKVAKYHYADKALIEKAIENSLSNRERWEKMPFSQRGPIFMRAAELMATKYRYDMLATTMVGQAKTPIQADIDAVAESIDFLKFNHHYARDIYEGPALHQPKTVMNHVEYRGLEGFIAAISPFNFTAIGVNLAGSPAMGGNVVLWKPSDTAMLSGWLVYKILRESGLPDGIIQFVPCDGPLFGDVITNSPDLAGISFTGSSKTFKNIWKSVGNGIENYKTFPRLVGECGGKNLHFIHESADVDTVVNGTILSSFEFGGQKCSACSRLYVPDTLWPQIKEKLVNIMGQLKLGNPEEYSTYLSAVIDERSFDKISSYIDYARNSPQEEIVAGGKCDKSVGYFVEPTLIETKDPNSKLLNEEIFGPVLTAFVYPASEYKEYMKLASTTSPYGLTGSIFAKNRNVIEDACEIFKQSAGNFYINDKSTGSVVGQQPFGGARASGTNDKAGMNTYMLKWLSPRSIKESLVHINNWRYPCMDS
ncbi:delta-1-pyrroline-5-carboxylate dehydrogenase, mitochondrial-like [Rhopilema esculentum]|uniref:delta-1-pyrroline-5-carboxylate dehydrogenase, mitochondrial-like n=1 Tax=Rhopilema esculentum TaxID=499914 RepID=UPI0031DACABC